MRREIQRVLAAASGGLSVEALCRDVSGDADVLTEVGATLVRDGVARETGGLLSAVRLDADRARASNDARLDAECAELLRAAGLTPPDLATLTTSLERKRALDRLVRCGTVIRAPDLVQKRVLVFHENAIEQAKNALRPLLTRASGVSVGEAGQALGISRKFCVPLLEYLDSTRFTRRVQDHRILGVEPYRTALG
jgi:selenocysteine-specific elongation factor